MKSVVKSMDSAMKAMSIAFIALSTLTKDMKSVVKSMDSAMKAMDIEKITKVMDKFEKQFEDLDLNSQYMEEAMDSTTANTMPQTDVDGLMHQIADENNLEFEANLDDIGIGKSKPAEKKEESKDEDDLADRLQR